MRRPPTNNSHDSSPDDQGDESLGDAPAVAQGTNAAAAYAAHAVTTEVMALRDLNQDQLKALRKTLPPTDAVTLPVGQYDFHADIDVPFLLLLGVLPLLGVTAEPVVSIVATLIIWAIAIFSAGKFEPHAIVAKQNHKEAKALLKSAIKGDNQALDSELHLRSHSNGQVSAALPAVGAQWTLQGNRRAKVQVSLIVERSHHAELTTSHTCADGLAPAQSEAWSNQWLRNQPEVRRRAGADSAEVSALMNDVARLIDTDVSYEDDNMVRLLETMRTDCDESVALYLELTPDEASRPLRSGKTATAELITLLELINTKAAQMRADGVLATGDNLSFLRRLSEQRFTRSDLHLG